VASGHSAGKLGAMFERDKLSCLVADCVDRLLCIAEKLLLPYIEGAPLGRFRKVLGSKFFQSTPDVAEAPFGSIGLKLPVFFRKDHRIVGDFLDVVDHHHQMKGEQVRLVNGEIHIYKPTLQSCKLILGIGKSFIESLASLSCSSILDQPLQIGSFILVEVTTLCQLADVVPLGGECIDKLVKLRLIESLRELDQKAFDLWIDWARKLLDGSRRKFSLGL